MDPPRVTCPNCGKTDPITPRMQGRSVRCPKCQTSFFVPEPEPEPFAFPPIEEKLFPLAERLNDPILWNVLRGLVPLAARATLIGVVASLGSWIYSLPPHILI